MSAESIQRMGVSKPCTTTEPSVFGKRLMYAQRAFIADNYWIESLRGWSRNNLPMIPTPTLGERVTCSVEQTHFFLHGPSIVRTNFHAVYRYCPRVTVLRLNFNLNLSWILNSSFPQWPGLPLRATYDFATMHSNSYSKDSKIQILESRTGAIWAPYARWKPWSCNFNRVSFGSTPIIPHLTRLEPYNDNLEKTHNITQVSRCDVHTCSPIFLPGLLDFSQC